MVSGHSISKQILLLAIACITFVAFGVIGLTQKPKVKQSTVFKGSYETDVTRKIEEQVRQCLEFELPKIVLWTVPPSQSPDGKWSYDIFTPPRIYVNPETGAFEPTPYQFKKTEVAPELAIQSVSRKLFRFQLAGFIENNLTDASQSIILLEDLDNHETMRVRFAAGSEVGDYKMLSFNIARTVSESGAIQRIGELQLESFNKSRITLQTASPTYSSGYVLSLTYGDDHFELTDDSPVFEGLNEKIIWLTEQTVYPNFRFQIEDHQTSASRTIELLSYLTANP